MSVHAAAESTGSSFVTLVEPHLDYLYAFAFRLSGDRAGAEDLVQDALVRAFRARDALRNREQPRSWLTKVLLSASADRARKDAPREHDVPLEDERFSLFDTLAEEDPFPYSDRLHLDFLDLFDDEKLTEALQRITPTHRAALLLAYVYGYKAREIADITGTTTGTVLARLHRGRKQLERALWDYAKQRGLLKGEDRR
ncbi:MAG TPA: RNA polymerase sigma factor [Candidatus Limnocylindria bacterium]|nr:RNA polymerase sigma factor [Candidatus Limnocylindria bacterium]